MKKKTCKFNNIIKRTDSKTEKKKVGLENVKVTETKNEQTRDV